MITVLVAFVATIIFQWGGGGFSGQRPRDTVGRINGEDISIRQFDNYFTNLYRQEQDKTDDELPPEKVKELRNKAWAQLVTDYLMQKEINKRDIVISNEEIYSFLKMYPPQALQSSPQFATDGQFDYQKYLQAMRNPENAPYWAYWEQLVIPELKKYKLQEEVLNTVRVTPSEVMNEFLAERERIRIGYINISGSSLRDSVPEPTEEEMQAYYNENIENYKRARRATANIVIFDKEPSENDWDRTYYEIKDLYDTLIAGGDFAEMAQIYSEDPGSASKGGDLSWFPKGRMVGEFDSVAWSMEVDEISEPFRSPFGWHIIKLLGRKTAPDPYSRGSEEPVEQLHAAHILIKSTPSSETLDQLMMNAQEFVDVSRDDGFRETAETFNYEIETTAPFDENGFMSPIRSTESTIKFVFNNEEGSVSEIMENSTAYFVVQVDSRIPEGYTPFEDAKGVIKGEIVMQKSMQLASEKADEIYQAVTGGMELSEVGEAFGYEYQETPFFNRRSPIPGLGSNPTIIGAAFAMQGKNTISKPITYDRGAALVNVLEKQSASLEQYNEVQDSVQFALIQKKHQSAYNQWFDGLIERAEIEDYLDELYQ